jgi:hypothetical protein
MPTFIDRHSLTALPSAVRRQMRLETRRHTRGHRGTRPIARWVGQWAEDGVIYCILEAPDAVAACQHHVDRGLPCEEIHVIDKLDERAPTSEEHKATVRAAIDDLRGSVAHRQLAELRGTLDEWLDSSKEHN